MIVDIGIIAAKAFLVLFMVLNLAGILGWIERKGSALIQDRVGANRASILGFAGLGLVNTLIADRSSFSPRGLVPPQGDRFLHTLAPCMALFTALVTFAVIPFGDVLVLGKRVINLQVANLNVGILYVFAIGSLGVYGIVIGAWASNNKFSLLGGVRGSAQMISYEVAMGLSVIGILMIFGTLELQEIVRGQGILIRDMLPESAGYLRSTVGWLPAWGIFLQPLAFLLSSRPLRRPNDSFRPAGRRIGAGGGLSRGIFRWQIPDVLCRLVRRDCNCSGSHDDAVFWRVASSLSDARRLSFSLERNRLAPAASGDRVAGGSVHRQGVVFLLVANFAALERAEISLRSSHAVGLENASPSRSIERGGNGDCDCRRPIEFSAQLMDASVILFYVISLLLVLSSLAVVFLLRNVVHCAMALVSALFLIAILFVMLHAPMVGVFRC
jgi:hypothetical protein